MIVTLTTQNLSSLEQVRSFLAGAGQLRVRQKRRTLPARG